MELSEQGAGGSPGRRGKASSCGRKAGQRAGPGQSQGQRGGRAPALLQLKGLWRCRCPRWASALPAGTAQRVPKSMNKDVQEELSPRLRAGHSFILWASRSTSPPRRLSKDHANTPSISVSHSKDFKHSPNSVMG